MPAGVPISIILLNTLTAFGGLVAVRVARRAAWERSMSRQRAARNSGKGRSAVLLVGAGSAGVMAVREIRSRGEHDMDLRGFVDDAPAKQGAVISGLRVLGATESLPVLVPALGIDQVIITIAEAPQAQMRRIVQICERIPVKAQMIPAMYDLLQGKVSITQLREVRVEDLLHRETVSLEEHDLVGPSAPSRPGSIRLGPSKDRPGMAYEILFADETGEHLAALTAGQKAAVFDGHRPPAAP